MNPPRPVLIVFSALAGFKALLTVAAVSDLIGAQVTGIILGVLLAVDVGAAFYVQGRVVPLSDTLVYERNGKLRAGQAAEQTTGTVVRPTATVAEVAGIRGGRSWLEDPANERGPIV